jgi:DNA gyrase subunit A
MPKKKKDTKEKIKDIAPEAEEIQEETKDTEEEKAETGIVVKDSPGTAPADITKEMRQAYLDYAMSVIVSRALPDVRDGLKPVQRRIIYAMQDQNVTASGKFQKCASVVGEVMKRYHPHGDSSIYEALVRMGQDFSLRYPLIWPQGNFGSIDGDPAAAMRYTECKMQKITEELYRDIEKETVDYEMNDLQNMEPTYLPSVLPNLLLNGATGIAVGMATNIPPHNLTEVISGIGELIDKADNIGKAPAKSEKGTAIKIFDGKQGEVYAKVAKTSFESKATVEDLVQHIKGPDFPTGGIIYDHKEIVQLYATGKGRVVTRAKMDVEEMKGGKMRLVVTEIPYPVNKATLISKIASLVKTKKIVGISDLRDESNKKGMRIVIELKRDAVVKKVQNRLFKYTQLQNTFSANMVALLDNEPKLMTLKTILEEFIKHRQQIVVRRTLYLLRRAREREHILQGLKKAIDNIDEVIELIKKSKDVETARKGLMSKFGFTEVQAQAILDMQLRRLAALERQKIEDELAQIIKTIDGYEKLLASPEEIIKTVRKELDDINEKYGDERKTKVIKGQVGKLSEEDLVKNERCVISISQSGYIKRMKDSTYKRQGRGGKGVKGQTLKEEDIIDTIRTCETHDWALIFTNTGKVYKMRVWDIPEAGRNAKGTPLVNFLSIKQNESVEAFLALTNGQLEGKGFVFFVTQLGTVKRTSLADFANIRSSGIRAINLTDDDSLVFAGLTDGKQDVLVTTSEGQSIRFKETDSRSMGRAARGVSGIKLKKAGDKVVGATTIPATEKDTKNLDLLVVAGKGYGKRTNVSAYKIQNRGGSGILTYKVAPKTGKLVSAKLLDLDAKPDILVASRGGKVIRLKAESISRLKRDTMGVKLINLGASDAVTSVGVLEKEEETPAEEEKATKK